MFLAASGERDFRRFFGQPLRKIIIEPVAALRTNAQVTTSFAVDPAREVDPLRDFVRSFAIPGQVFAQVTVRFSGIVAKAFEYIDADFFSDGIFRVLLEEFGKQWDHVMATPF